MSLTSPDSNGIGRYTESTPIGTQFSAFMNLGLEAVSAVLGRPQQVANGTALAAMTGMIAGDRARRADNGIIYRYSGSAWVAWESEWISYTPTWTNLVVGTGGDAANTAAYKYTNGKVNVEGVVVFGSTGASVSGAVSFTLPVTATTRPFTNTFYRAASTLFDASAPATNEARVRANGTSTNSASILAVVSGTPANLSATIPWTWAAGDSIHYEFEYRPA